MQKREKEWLLPNPNNKIKIGIVGEIYTIIEPTINFDIINKLKKLGCNVDVSTTQKYVVDDDKYLEDWKKDG